MIKDPADRTAEAQADSNGAAKRRFDKSFVVGVDIGGTCTDTVVLTADGKTIFGKAFSTPPDFSKGILDAVGVAGEAMGIDTAMLLRGTALFLHSTTVAENAVTNGNLASVGLITTQGFEDTIFMMRGGYGRWSGLTEDEKRDPVSTSKPPPLVSRSLVRSIAERTDSRGETLQMVDPKAAEAAVTDLVTRGADSMAVCFLWSFVNPANEQTVGAVIRRLYPNRFVTLSHRVAPVLGEYERTSTTTLNSALGPVVTHYLQNLSGRLTELGFNGTFLVGQGYGGLLPLDAAADQPVGMIESGPIMGIIGARAIGESMGYHNIIAADMGGTTFKVGVVRDGMMEYQPESMVYRYHFALPKLDVVSLGLAGGSIISIDQRTGLPQIGPRSAGSYPGPICYDHGGEEPTVTDVDAILGYLNPGYFLGGRERLNIEKAKRIFKEKISDPLGLGVTEAAAAMYRLTNSMIYDLLHKVTVERGLDPREYALFSFGGTAGMHVSAYGEELGVKQLVIPYSASVHGAFGLVTADVVHEYQTTQLVRAPGEPRVVNAIFASLAAQATSQLQQEGFALIDIHLQRSIDMRHRRQVHVLNVPLEQDGDLDEEALERVVERFETLYEGRYGKNSGFLEAGVEMVSFRIRGTGKVRTPALQAPPLESHDPTHALRERRTVYVAKGGAEQEVNGYDFERLRPGNRVSGPAVIWTPITTVVLGPEQVAEMDAHKNLVVTRG
jgi:N-methylhydantoinase A